MKFFLFSVVLLLASTASADVFFVNRVAVKSGKQIPQEVEVLDRVEDLDDQSGYVTFRPNRHGKIAAVFTVKGAPRFSSGKLKVNLRSDEPIDQEVKFFIRNFKRRKYELIGIHELDKLQSWQSISFSLPQRSAAYKRKNRMKIKMVAESIDTPLLLDQLIIASHFSPAEDVAKASENSQFSNILPTESDSNPSIPGGGFTEEGFLAGLTWYWQLQGKIKKNYRVDVYDIDLEDNASSGAIDRLKKKGIKVICYFSAGSYEKWRSDAWQFPEEILGENLNGWPDERWLDVRHETTKSIMAQRMDLAADAGCDAVEPDNVDGYQNTSGFSLTEADQLDYLSWLADYAQDKGLKIGLKNSLDLIQVGDLHKQFDFLVNEECYSYEECEKMKPFIDENKAVFIAQYEGYQDQYCLWAAQDDYSLTFFNLDLNRKGYIPCNSLFQSREN